MNTNTLDKKSIGPQYLKAAIAWISKKDAPKQPADSQKKAAERHAAFNATLIEAQPTD
ncbi:MAG: hypothetical protein LRY36_00835 [Alphaproteobacteria bacterium]|nr:hypothetical protein [Alphaproteobacteria bacterium]MCD8566473.1 hypothetical protein [Alphaproteobacteria bacterium]